MQIKAYYQLQTTLLVMCDNEMCFFLTNVSFHDNELMRIIRSSFLEIRNQVIKFYFSGYLPS